MQIRTTSLPTYSPPMSASSLPNEAAVSRLQCAADDTVSIATVTEGGVSGLCPMSAQDTQALGEPLFGRLMSSLRAWTGSLSGYMLSKEGTDTVSPASTAMTAVAASTSGKPDYAGNFSVTVKTRDGDTVTIRFGETRDDDLTGSTNAVSARYDVEGTLSDDERQALDKVVTKVVDIADTFFSSSMGFGHLAVMDDLRFFDASQLAGFALDMGQDRQFHPGDHAERAYSSLSFAYDVDMEGKSQHLRSELLLGYQQGSGSGLQRFGYDVSSSIDQAAKTIADRADVSGLGRPAPCHSAPTALPAYYQGALHALASNVDQLSALLDDGQISAFAQPASRAVSDLFRSVAEHHPVYRSTSLPVRQSLSGMLAMLPALITESGQIQRGLFKRGIQISA